MISQDDIEPIERWMRQVIDAFEANRELVMPGQFMRNEALSALRMCRAAALEAPHANKVVEAARAHAKLVTDAQSSPERRTQALNDLLHALRDLDHYRTEHV
jgi:hypothetical protein